MSIFVLVELVGSAVRILTGGNWEETTVVGDSTSDERKAVHRRIGHVPKPSAG